MSHSEVPLLWFNQNRSLLSQLDREALMRMNYPVWQVDLEPGLKLPSYEPVEVLPVCMQKIAALEKAGTISFGSQRGNGMFIYNDGQTVLGNLDSVPAVYGSSYVFFLNTTQERAIPYFHIGVSPGFDQCTAVLTKSDASTGFWAFKHAHSLPPQVFDFLDRMERSFFDVSEVRLIGKEPRPLGQAIKDRFPGARVSCSTVNTEGCFRVWMMSDIEPFIQITTNDTTLTPVSHTQFESVAA